MRKIYCDCCGEEIKNVHKFTYPKIDKKTGVISKKLEELELCTQCMAKASLAAIQKLDKIREQITEDKKPFTKRISNV